MMLAYGWLQAVRMMMSSSRLSLLTGCRSALQLQNFVYSHLPAHVKPKNRKMFIILTNVICLYLCLFSLYT
jgi:hypothetical protein